MKEPPLSKNYDTLIGPTPGVIFGQRGNEGLEVEIDPTADMTLRPLLMVWPLAESPAGILKDQSPNQPKPGEIPAPESKSRT
jgi:hypothetical protein